MALFESENEDYWIPLADIMTGLMLIFLLIAVGYIIKAKKDSESIKQELVVKQKQEQQLMAVSHQIYLELNQQFASDLLHWQASIESQNLTIKFYSPEVFFETGQATLKPGFKQILQDFIPRYLKVLRNYPDIAEVRINGYASNFWGALHDPDQIYLKNMQLSEQRSLNVLNYIHQITHSSNDLLFLREHFTANGFSSAHATSISTQQQNLAEFQKVEFKITLKDE